MHDSWGPYLSLSSSYDMYPPPHMTWHVSSRSIPLSLSSSLSLSFRKQTLGVNLGVAREEMEAVQNMCCSLTMSHCIECVLVLSRMCSHEKERRWKPCRACVPTGVLLHCIECVLFSEFCEIDMLGHWLSRFIFWQRATGGEAYCRT